MKCYRSSIQTIGMEVIAFTGGALVAALAAYDILRKRLTGYDRFEDRR